MSAPMWDDEAEAPSVDYVDVDADAEPFGADSPLLDPGSDGLVTAPREQLLRELWRRREAGDSLDQIRRDAGQIDPFKVSNRTLERALDRGRQLEEWSTMGRWREPSRRWHGIAVRPCPACGRRVLQRALRRAGCVLCSEGV